MHAKERLPSPTLPNVSLVSHIYHQNPQLLVRSGIPLRILCIDLCDHLCSSSLLLVVFIVVFVCLLPLPSILFSNKETSRTTYYGCFVGFSMDSTQNKDRPLVLQTGINITLARIRANVNQYFNHSHRKSSNG